MMRFVLTWDNSNIMGEEGGKKEAELRRGNGMLQEPCTTPVGPLATKAEGQRAEGQRRGETCVCIRCQGARSHALCLLFKAEGQAHTLTSSLGGFG
jgi:hypothetical protein